MEKLLTKKDGKFYFKGKEVNPQYGTQDLSPNDNLNLYNHFAELSDKLENGTLYDFRFRVGQKVYIVCNWDINKVVDGEVTMIELTADKNGVSHRIYVDHKYIHSDKNPVMIAHRYIFTENELFFSKEQAEVKLAELKGNKQ